MLETISTMYILVDVTIARNYKKSYTVLLYVDTLQL